MSDSKTATLPNHKFNDLLAKAYQKNRLGHAYLFLGNNMSLISAILTEFGQMLFCKELTDKPCRTCSGCSKVKKGIHPDILALSPSGPLRMIKINQIRTLTERLSLMPQEGNVKLAIIWEAETMNTDAANAFLKTLEEPPERTLIVLVTRNPGGLLPTIRSRCQLLRFGIGTLFDEAEWSRELSLDRFSLRLLWDVSFGDIEAARDMIESGSWERLRTMIEGVLHGIFGSSLDALITASGISSEIDDYKAILTAELQQKLSEMEIDEAKFKKVQEEKNAAYIAGEVKKEWEQFFQLLLTVFVLTAEKKQSETASESSLEQYCSRLSQLDKRFFKYVVEHIETCRRHIQRNMQPLLALENMMLQIKT